MQAADMMRNTHPIEVEVNLLENTETDMVAGSIQSTKTLFKKIRRENIASINVLNERSNWPGRDLEIFVIGF